MFLLRALARKSFTNSSQGSMALNELIGARRTKRAKARWVIFKLAGPGPHPGPPEGRASQTVPPFGFLQLVRLPCVIGVSVSARRRRDRAARSRVTLLRRYRSRTDT